MALNAHGDKPAIIGEINITPLTDIFLVLLIIMMVVAPMMEQNRADIKPPDLSSGTPVEQGKVTVEVTQQGAFYVKGKQASDAELTDVLKSLVETAKEKNVVIRADKATKSGVVMKVLESARDAGYEKVTVSGEALTDSRQSELQQSTSPSDAQEMQ